MRRVDRCLAQAIAIVVILAGCYVPQLKAQEKHVSEIVADNKARHPEGPSGSGLCQWARNQQPPYGRDHFRQVSPAAVEKDLLALAQKSDEVVLAGVPLRAVTAFSLSDQDVVIYRDVKVLRTWKGSHKIGSLLTFSIPDAAVVCGLHSDVATTVTGLGPYNNWLLSWNGTKAYEGTLVLFLRQDDTGLTEGLRLTGADGMQGMFFVPSDLFREGSELHSCARASFDPEACRLISAPECRDQHTDQETIAKCNSALDASKRPVATGLNHDPLREKYNGMPISRFLKEVQSAVAASGATNEMGGVK